MSQDPTWQMIEKIKKREVEFVRLETADTTGTPRGFLLDADYFLRQYKNGFLLITSSLSMQNSGAMVPNTGYMGEINYRDGCLYPDFKTFVPLPWTDKNASVLADYRTESHNPESPYISGSPRAICKMQLEKLSALGLRMYSAFEFEFYLLNKETKTRFDSVINFGTTLQGAKHAPLMQDIMRNLKAIGIEPEGYNGEWGPCQHELTIIPAFGITGADNAFRYKEVVKELALKHGCMATFMSKPYKNDSGSSGHFNHSLWDAEGNNSLYDQNEKYGLSKIAQHWLAGLIYHSDALLCLASSTPNCFERTNATGAFAPINNSWGLDNRSCAYRVKNNSTKRIFFENRLAPSAVNPYLLTAGTIIAGIDGIKRELPLIGDPLDGNAVNVDLPSYVKALPKSLSESLNCLEKNEVFVKELGGEFLKCFTTIKRAEERLAEEKRESGDLFQWYMDFYGTFI